MVKVQVHDGLAMRAVTISTLDGLFDLLEKIATAMKRPNNLVEMGYEAPWSAKIGTKKSLAYVSNEEELDDFWLSYARYVAKQGGKKQKKAEEVVIVFSNMQDIAKVSPLLAMNIREFTICEEIHSTHRLIHV